MRNNFSLLLKIKMGLDQSKEEKLDQNWESLSQKVNDVPGRPEIVRSMRRYHLLAERYCLEINSTNCSEQISIYKERRISAPNIVALYDFEVTKAFLGCARNMTCYHVITERIPHRLSNFQNLGMEEIVYILHEALNGYSELSKYNKVCYPAANMIGVKENGQIKVWINPDWSQNGLRSARSVSSSIDALWNTIQLHSGDFRSLSALSTEIHQQKPFEFQKLTCFLREKYNRQIFEGKVKLERRIKEKRFLGESHIDKVDISRSRAYSENIRKPATPASPAHEIKKKPNSPAFVFLNDKCSKPVQIQTKSFSKSFAHESKKNELQERIQIHIHPKQFNPIFQNPKNGNGREVVSFSHDRPNKPSFFTNSPPPSTGKGLGNTMEKSIERSSKNAKINFSYAGSRKEMDLNVSPWKDEAQSLNFVSNERLSQTTKTTKKRYYQKSGEVYNRNILFEKNSHKIGYEPIIEPFQLEMKLQQARQKQNRSKKETSSIILTREKDQVYEKHPSCPIDSSKLETENQECSTPVKKREDPEEMQVVSDSKKAAEEFKYYLRQLMQTSPTNLSVQVEKGDEEALENNSRCIVERWEEEESFNA